MEEHVPHFKGLRVSMFLALFHRCSRSQKYAALHQYLAETLFIFGAGYHLFQ